MYINELYSYLIKLLVYFGDRFNLEEFLKVSKQSDFQKHLYNLSETVLLIESFRICGKPFIHQSVFIVRIQNA